MSATLTWIAIAAIVAAYTGIRTAATVELAKSPDANWLVDPTRYSHDGTQPLTYKEGNRKPAEDYAARRTYDALGY